MFEWWSNLVSILVYNIWGFEKGSQFGDAIHFFIYDSAKILFLLFVIIYIVTYLRSFFPMEKIKKYLDGKHKLLGHILASLFGMITPFCSCSAIPLFLGFLKARIPLGVTFSYLISAPLSDAVVIALLFSLFGIKITLFYIIATLSIAIIGGMAIGALKLEKEVLLDVTSSQNCCQKSKVQDTQSNFNFSTIAPQKENFSPKKMSNSWSKNNKMVTYKNKRFKNAYIETMDIFKKIYLYVFIGIGIGAFIYGYVPTDFIVKYAGQKAWYAPIIGVIMGIPMYSSAAGVLPLVEVLTQKGMLLGTALSFMMAVVALSLPEALILKRVLSFKLLSIFFGIVGVAIIVVGFVFNLII